MTVLVLLALGHLAGLYLARQLRARQARYAEFAGTAAGGGTGLLVFVHAGDLDPDTLHELLRPALGGLAEPLTVLFLLAAILTALYGFCVMIGYLVLLLGVGLVALRHTKPKVTPGPAHTPADRDRHRCAPSASPSAHARGGRSDRPGLADMR